MQAARRQAERQERRLDRAAVQAVGGTQQGEHPKQPLVVIAAAEDSVPTQGGDIAAVVERQVREPAALLAGEREMIPSGGDHSRPFPGVVFIVNGAADVMNEGGQPQQAAMAAFQFVQRGGQVEDRRGDGRHPPLVFDRAKLSPNPAAHGVQG